MTCGPEPELMSNGKGRYATEPSEADMRSTSTLACKACQREHARIDVPLPENIACEDVPSSL
jgi:hypothetical protein